MACSWAITKTQIESNFTSYQLCFTHSLASYNKVLFEPCVRVVNLYRSKVLNVTDWTFVIVQYRYDTQHFKKSHGLQTGPLTYPTHSIKVAFLSRMPRVLPHNVLCMSLTMFNASLLHYLPWGAGHVVGVLTPRANPPQNPKIGSRAHHVMWCTSCGTCWTFFPEVVHPRPFGLHLFNTREGMELLGTCQFRHSNSVHFKFVVFRPQDFMNFLTF